MKWTAVIVLGWLSVISVNAVQFAIPASYWFEPSHLHVSDAARGECPHIEYERTISQPFRADWTATIDHRNAGGGFSVWSVHTGSADYSPETVVPPDADLCWWIWPATIALPTGHYRVRTLWELDLPGGKEIRRGSNVFEVK